MSAAGESNYRRESKIRTSLSALFSRRTNPISTMRTFREVNLWQTLRKSKKSRHRNRHRHLHHLGDRTPILIVMKSGELLSNSSAVSCERVYTWRWLPCIHCQKNRRNIS